MTSGEQGLTMQPVQVDKPDALEICNAIPAPTIVVDKLKRKTTKSPSTVPIDLTPV